MISSIAREREENERALKRALGIATEVKASEREGAVQNKTLKAELSSAELNTDKKKKSIFISYCWLINKLLER